ncbi:beta-N-acetylhexosaminidase [Parvibaculum sp.]|uniref:beta-N-acetylhexosaminidase n=2 Tax=Parvibaculum sp. TaxID=2024848 RepID=UPI001B0A498A|nr:beta-N-acetylhexosaminidase [Parvibaculum sp.]MBO6635749.1 beta-N-acetylhexosaminidase [Parvibaculum sp.]MBO6679069.1 beta-N-acetylhexosaminidase [Parvibaculum sp.]MBO6903782.1 beta-N-acetylhexosaminidase [Parvibaculum sp.]
MSVRAAIYGCAGTRITEGERHFFREARPWGFILFARNIADPGQVRQLVGELREAAGHEAEVLIDQEGGRVQRLTPPNWRGFPPGRRYGELYEADVEQGLHAARLGAKLIAAELRHLGITVDCLPVLDVPVPGAHDVIGDRAYADTPGPIAALGLAAAEGLLSGGVLPVIKHIPGHGRAGVDSHKSLPVVDTPADELSRIDFAPFHALRHMPLAMTAHVVYTALDRDRPATTSPSIIGGVIRGEIGFDGLLMSDDLSMEALKGSLGERARRSLEAGCDLVLHCNGKMTEMEAVAAEVPILSGRPLERSEAAISQRKTAIASLDIDSVWQQFSGLIATS